MYFKFLLTFTSFLLLLSCNNRAKLLKEKELKTNKEDIVGGSCKYRHTISKAIISSIKIDDQKNASIKYKTLLSANSNFEMKAYFNNYDLADKTKYPGKEFATLKVNDTVTLETQDIVSGSCTPTITLFTLTKFPYKKDTTYVE
jgi:hypothetical protein